ncbi:MAG: HAD hydrolase family protein [Candidatus Eisenbacteria bacterium]|uniref:HAD hydrolase family protein n=1 Tax=Eiseniibacteriota bacterium TaxID=2212470 RepID=A0A9D6QNM1_UNCEI|nr:HAD hydrolase family protein [Candidatus Eisenbacteria bacterium]
MKPRASRSANAGAARRAPIAGPVRILFLDVDGTLTDGAIGFDRDGDSRRFSIRDGLSLEWARGLDVLPVVLSGRDSEAVRLRMADLSLEYYGGLKDKVAVAERVLARERVGWRECAMVGDDLPDVPMLKRVGWPIAVGDAVREVKQVATTVTAAAGGRGAVREVVEMVLRHNGTWVRVLERYQAV